jgi:hypothetical protein
MNKREIAEKRLNEFAANITSQLECFVKEENLLLPGQRAVFSIKVEEVPLVVQGAIDANPALDMSWNDFFTLERFKEAGVDAPTAGRAIRAIDNAMGRESDKTVRGFIANFDRQLRSGGQYFLPNAGPKSKRAVRTILARAGCRIPE